MENNASNIPLPPRRGVHGPLAFLRELLLVIIGAIIVSSLLRAFVGQMFIIPSDSMQNTLLQRDRVVVQKITAFHRGDVVVFADPDHWLGNDEAKQRGPVGKVFEFIGVLPDTSTGHLIKRVIGMPGDQVACCDAKGRITVNGTALSEKPYLYSSPQGDHDAASEVTFTVIVPKGHIFVMGDHRHLSADSRCHLSDLSSSQGKGQVAFIPVNIVVGPAFAIAAPLDRAKRLHIPDTFTNVSAPTKPAPDVGAIQPEGVTC